MHWDLPLMGKARATSCRTARRAHLLAACAGDRGFTIIEALIAAMFVGIAVIGTGMMYGTAAKFVRAEGDNRVAFYVAQQRMEQIRSTGFGASSLPDVRQETTAGGVQINNDSDANAVPGFLRQTLITGVCPTNYALAWNDGTCPTNTVLLAKLVTVSVRSLDGPSTQTDPQTQPVVIQSVILAP